MHHDSTDDIELGAKQGIMATRGIQALNEAGITHRVLTYDFREKGANYAAQATGFPPERMIKSLVAALDTGEFVFALLPATLELSTKKLARVARVKAAEMALPKKAESLTGYLTGGMSPLGSRRTLTVYLHAELAVGREEVVLNAGARGTLVALAADDLIRVTGARVADLGA